MMQNSNFSAIALDSPFNGLLESTETGLIEAPNASDALTPANRGPAMMPIQGGAFLNEEDSPLLGEEPTQLAIDKAIQAGANFFNEASSAVNNTLNQTVNKAIGKTVEATADVAAGLASSVTSSTRNVLSAASESWNAPDNRTHNAINQQYEKMAKGVSQLTSDVNNSEGADKVRQYRETVSNRLSALTDGIYSELGYAKTPAASAEKDILEQAELRLKENILDLRNSSDFEAIFQTAFGDQANSAEASAVVDDFIDGQAAPNIEVVSSESLQGGAAFGNNTIFISDQYLADNAENTEAIDKVLLEETGHYFDKALNTTDTAGDEGDIFARLALGKTLSEAELQTLRAENDHSTLLHGEEVIEVENFWDSVSSAYDSFSSSVSDTYNSVADTVSDTYDSASEAVSDTYNDFTTAVSDTYDSASETISDTYDSVAEFVTEDIPQFVTEDIPQFVTEDVPEWMANNESTVNRIIGGVQVISGVGETVTGALLVPTGAVSLGVGSVAGVGLAAHGADTTWAGLKALWTGEAQETYTKQGVTAVTDAIPGVTSEQADTIGNLVDMGIGIVGPLGAAKFATGSVDNIVSGTADNFAGSVLDDVPVGAQCFVAGTPILTSNGKKSIEELRTGDRVISWDEETGAVIECPVTEWYRREALAIVDIFIGTEKISCTTDHPFWVQDKWVLAYQLKAGTVLQTHEGKSLTIDEVRRRDEVTQVYNVEIDGLHTYFVSSLEILSHNMCGGVDDLVTDSVGRPANSPHYEVGFEAKLEQGKDFPGISDKRHFQEANRQLHEAMQSDPAFAQGLEDIYPGVTEGVQPGARGAYPRRSPTSETTWHHEANREGAMQLVPLSQHQARGPVQQSLHPQGRGGMENWGGGRR